MFKSETKINYRTHSYLFVNSIVTIAQSMYKLQHFRPTIIRKLILSNHSYELGYSIFDQFLLLIYKSLQHSLFDPKTLHYELN